MAAKKSANGNADVTAALVNAFNASLDVTYLETLKARLVPRRERPANYVDMRRVSSLKQENNTSLKEQERLHDFGKNVLHCDLLKGGDFAFVESAYKIKRRRVREELIPFLCGHANEIQYLVVTEADRMFRGLYIDQDIYFIEEVLCIRIAGPGLPECKNARERADRRAVWAASNKSSAEKEHTAKTKMLPLAKEHGQKLHRQGIGYMENPDKKLDPINQVSMIKDPKREHHIRQIFEWRAEGMRFPDIRDKINAAGLTTRPTQKIPSHPITLAHLYKIVKNPIYMGGLVCNYVDAEDDEIEHTLDRQGDWEPIVTPDLWEAAQAASRKVTPTKRQRANVNYPWRGTMVCKECGEPLTVYKAKSKTGEWHHYAHCYNKQSAKHGNEKCPLYGKSLKDLAADPGGKVAAPYYPTKLRPRNLHDEATSLSDNEQPSAKTFDKLDAEIDRCAMKYRKAAQRDVDKQTARKAELKTLLSDTLDLMLLAKQAGRKLETYQEKLDTLQRELDGIEALAKGKRWWSTAESVRAFKAKLIPLRMNIRRRWENADLHGKQKLQRELFPDGIVWDGLKFEPVRTQKEPQRLNVYSCLRDLDAALSKNGVPKGIRTPVAAVKGRCPRPTRRWGRMGVCGLEPARKWGL